MRPATAAGPAPGRRAAAGPSGGGGGNQRFWSVVFIGAICLIGGLGLVIWRLPHWLTRDTSTPLPAASPSAEARHIRATLFYVSDDGNQLIAVDREVPLSAGPAEQAHRIVEMQVAPAPGGLVSPIPPGTSVRSVFLTAKGEAYVDLSHEVSTAHSGGSLDEALTVFAIVNALTTNLPDVKAVQILIDGKEVDTLAGHMDLRRPLSRAPEWVRKDATRK
jgi:spore germination protein GerM